MGNMNKYTGFKDSLLDFKGDAIDFASQQKMDKIFKVTIVNANSADQLVILNPSRYPSNPLRVIRDGNIPYTSGAADLSATGYPNTIAELLLFLKDNPTRVCALKVQTNNAAQLGNALTFTYRDVFAQPGSERISLDKYTTEYATNDKLVTVTKEFQLDNDTELGIIVPAAVTSGGSTINTTTIFTFTFGASLSTATALRNKRQLSL